MKLKKALQNSAIGLCTAAMVMAAPMSVLPVWADDATQITSNYTFGETQNTGSLTIHKYVNTSSLGTATGNIIANVSNDAHPLKDVQFSYAEVATISKSSVQGSVKLEYTLTAEGKTLLGFDNSKTTVTQKELADALGAKVEDIKTKKDVLEGTSTNLTAMDLTDSEGKTSAIELELGIYLIVETKVPENVHTTTNPFLVSIPMTDSVSVDGNYDGTKWNYDVHVYPKNQADNPTIDKQVKDNNDDAYADTTSVSMGDTVSYKITSQLPTINSKATYLTDYTFVDTLDSGLSYERDSSLDPKVKISFNDGADGVISTVWYTNTDLNGETEGTPYPFTVNYDNDNNNNKMTIVFTNDGLAKINPGMSGKTMTIEYTATVDNTPAANDKAADKAVLGDTGNKNEVALTFKRSNGTTSETIRDESIVYTYGLSLTKKFSDENGDASKVQFTLKRKNSNTATTEEYVVVKKAADGVYYADGTATNVTDNNNTKFSPVRSNNNKEGTLRIEGLEADTYTLTEVKTDTGYSLLKDSITINITPSKRALTADSLDALGNKVVVIREGQLTTATAMVDSETAKVTMVADNTSNNAIVPLTVVNTKSFTLPATGGLGSIIFTVLGAVVVGGAVIIIKKDKKKAE